MRALLASVALLVSGQPPQGRRRSPRGRRNSNGMSSCSTATSAQIKRAVANVDHSTLMGTPELQRRTGAFLDRLDRSTRR